MNLRHAAAEAIGTCALVLAGTAAIVVNDLYGGVLGHTGIAFAFGAVVMVMIYAIGDISGAHMNPAVTIAFWVSKRLPAAKVLPYAAAQFVGALAASLLVAVWFPAHDTLGATVPSGNLLQSLTVEIVATAILMFVILGVSEGAREKGIMAGVAVGGTVALMALVFGPVSGASMNPARSFGPALVSGEASTLWLYFVGPFIGALLAVPACRIIGREDCCAGEC
ncbi:MAG: aquaporin [Gammaproteobacteria bacterium]|nr:aquaporin [Gammaproteobacteria bacterium]NND54101.1 aquaporin [Gammaproteobacteria bacterium]